METIPNQLLLNMFVPAKEMSFDKISEANKIGRFLCPCSPPAVSLPFRSHLLLTKDKKFAFADIIIWTKLISREFPLRRKRIGSKKSCQAPSSRPSNDLQFLTYKEQSLAKKRFAK